MGRNYVTSGCGAFVAAACLLAGAGGSGAEDAKLIYRTYDASGGYWVTSVCDMDGKNKAKFALPLPKRFENKYFDPVRSPDGKKVAFFGTPNKGGGFFVADADGANAKRLTEDDEGYHSDLCWFPDGMRLVYRNGQDGRIWAVNADGTAPAALTKEKMECACPSVSPDGKQIALIKGKNKRRVVAVVDADGSNLKTLRNLGERFAGTVAWSPDGKRLLFNDNDLYAMNPDGSDVKQLTKLGGVNDLAWSPDGKFLLFSRYQLGAATPEVGDENTNFKSDVYVANADGSNAKIAVKGLDNGRPRWWRP